MILVTKNSLTDLLYLEEEDRDELKEELLSYLVENEVSMTVQQRNMAYQLARGHFSESLLSQVLQAVNDADPTFVTILVEKYCPLAIEPAVTKREGDAITTLMHLVDEDRDELKEEILSFVIENDIIMTPQEKNATYQFARGHYSETILTQVLQVVKNIDSTFLTNLVDKYGKLVKPVTKSEFKFEPALMVPEELMRTAVEDQPGNLFAGDLVTDLVKLSREDRDELQEELLSYLVDGDLKLNPQQRGVLNQFAKGNYSSNLLSQVIEIVNTVEPNILTHLTEKYVSLVLAPEVTTLGDGLATEFMRLSVDDRDELKDELLSYIVENDLKLTPQHRAVLNQFAKGNYTTNLFAQVVQVVNNVDPTFVSELSERYLPKMVTPEVTTLSEGMVTDLMRLAKPDQDDLKDELLSYIVENDIPLSVQEKSLFNQFARGHYSENTLARVLQVINKTDSSFITRLSAKYQPLVIGPELVKPQANLMDLSAADRDELKEELLSYIVENDLVLSVQEKAILNQFARGHYSENTLGQVFQIVNNVDPSFVANLMDRYQKLSKPVPKPEVQIASYDYMPPLESREKLSDLFEGDLVARLMKLSGGDREELQEEMLSLIVENAHKLTPQQRGVLNQFAKGNYTSNIVSQVLQVVNTVEPTLVHRLSDKYLKPEIKGEMKFGPLQEITADVSKNIMNRTHVLSQSVTNNLIDDLLSILSNDELKALQLTQRERMNVYQLIKGHANPNAVFNALKVGIRILEANKMGLAPIRKLKVPKFGVELIPTVGLENLVNFGRKLELADINNLWITDQYTNMDPYITLTMVAKATNTADLGVGLNNAYLLHPASTASAIASLDILSNNRMVLGLGTDNTSSLPVGNGESSNFVASMHETVQTFKELWTESKAELSVNPTRSIPIYIGAQGEKMLELAGEIGDGVLVSYSNETDLKMATKIISESAKKRNKSVRDIDLAAHTCFSVSDNAKLAMKATIPIVAFMVAGATPDTLERHDLKMETAHKIRGYIARGEMANAFRLVDDKYIEVFSISGTAQQVINKIESLKGAGMTQVVFGSPLGPKKAQAIDLITKSILPTYK